LRLNKGDDAVRRLIAGRKPMFEFMVRRVLAAHDLETVEGRVAALRAAAPVVAGIRDQALSIGYVRNLAKWLGMEPDEVRRAVATARSVAKPPERRPPQDRATEGGAPAAVAEPTVEEGPSLTALATDPVTRLERDALMAILQYPTEVGADLVARAAHVEFHDPALAVVRDAVASSLDQLGAPEWLAHISAEVPIRFATLVTQLAVAPIPERAEVIATYCTGVVGSLIDRDLLRQKRELLGTMQRIDASADPDRYGQVQRDLVRVESERRALRDE
jgi:DNA primase